MAKKKTKKVTAPLTYDPGKGRPKEHLAYLNWQEMQALKRLNGNNQERGPKGLPSFPPNDAIGSSSKASSTKSSTSKSSGPSSSLNAPARTAPSSSKSSTKSTGSSSVSRISGGTAGSNAARSAGNSRGSTQTGSSSVSRISGGTAGSNAARSAGTSRGSTVSGGASTTSRIGSAASSQRSGPAYPSGAGGGSRGIGGASDNLAKQAASNQSVLKATVSPALKSDIGKRPSTPMSTQGVSFQYPIDARIENRQRINDAKLASGALKPGSVPSISQIREDNARRAEANRLAQQYSQYRSPPSTPAPTPQGEFGPRAGVGTGYLRMAETPGMITSGMPSPYSGSIEPRYNAAATLRAYEREKKAQPFVSGASPYPAVRAGTSYMNPGGVPENVKNALADRGYNPDGTKMSPEAQRAYQTNKLIGQYSQYRSPPSVRTPQNQSLPPGFAADTPISGMPSLADVGQRLYDAAVGTGKAITGALGAGINALANVGVRPGSVVSTDQGLRIVGEDGTLTPYSLERERVVNMMRPDYAYTPPVDPAIGRMPRPAPQYGPMPTPTGEEGITPSSGLAAIPTPVSMGLIAPPRPRPRPENLRPAPPRPVARPSDLMDAYTPKYPGPDGVTDEDIGGVFEQGDGEVPDSAVPFSQIDPETMKAYGEMLGPVGMVNFSRMAEPSMAGIGQLVGDTTIRPALSRYGNVGGEMVGTLGNRGVVASAAPNPFQRTPGSTLPKSPFGVNPTDWGSFREGIIDQINEGYKKLTGRSAPNERILEVETLPEEGASPSQETASPSQDSTITPEAEEAQEAARRRAQTARRVSTPLLNIAAPGLGTVAGQVFKFADAQMQKLVDAYQDASMTERKAMEERYPNLIPRAEAMGINSYYGMDKYNAWAEKSGLRAPPSREGGGSRSDDQYGINRGITSDGISGDSGSDSGGGTGGTGGSDNGRRPYIYYEWDLGVNIPSPSDPTYTMYMTYLAERNAAQAAMYR